MSKDKGHGQGEGRVALGGRPHNMSALGRRILVVLHAEVAVVIGALCANNWLHVMTATQCTARHIRLRWPCFYMAVGN